MPERKTPEAKTQADEIREAAEADLETFIRLVSPKQVMGSVHSELCRWWTRQEASDHQLVLLPRDHQKSRMVAFRTVWEITKRPWIRVLYISSTANLAEKQLKFMKDLMTSAIYRRYWPEMIEKEEGKREKWTNNEISIDHPRRKEEAVRDPTIFTGGLTTNLVGMHCDIAVLDDTVTNDTAYTEEGRSKLLTQYSLLSSIESADSKEWVVGTRYHPKDLYSEMLEMEEITYDDDGEETGAVPIYEIFERAVEDRGDGTGQFLWPRQQRNDGQWFGFDIKILARKKGKYRDRTQFRAQYYNDPNDPDELRISRDKFQYYDQKFLTQVGGYWYYRDHKLNIYASVDFAYTTGARSDYTAIVVIGVDKLGNFYVVDVDRFKTDRISEMFTHIQELHSKWGFRKLAAEVTAAQNTIVQELKESYIKPAGLYLSVEEIKHVKQQGSKEERIAAILEPKYDNLAMWHYRGGHCQTLEDELVDKHPSHDDIIDALATAVKIAVIPSQRGMDRERKDNVVYNARFGGIRFG